MDSSAAIVPTAVLTMADLGVMVLLQVLIEERICSGADPHGVNTPSRVLEILTSWDRVERSDTAPALPWSEHAAEARAALRASVERATPMLSLGAVLAVRRRSALR